MHIETRCNFYLRFDRNFEFPYDFHLLANCSIASYRFAYETVPREQSHNSQARKFPRRDGATRTCHVALTLLVECQRRRRSLRNSKTNAKIRQISRTVRRIDSSFRGRCYEMDPCTTPRARWRESKREKDRDIEREGEREERRLECRQATLHLLRLFTFATTHHPRGESPTLGIPPRRGHLALYARYYFYKYTRYRISWSNSRGHRERKFDGIAQLIPFQRSSVTVRLWDPRSELPASPSLTIFVGPLSSLGPSTSWSWIHLLCLLLCRMSQVGNNVKDRGGTWESPVEIYHSRNLSQLAPEKVSNLPRQGYTP